MTALLAGVTGTFGVFGFFALIMALDGGARPASERNYRAVVIWGVLSSLSWGVAVYGIASLGRDY